MNKPTVLIGILAAVLALGLYTVRSHRASPSGVSGGNSRASHPLAPNFSVTDLKGQALKLSDFQGKVVLLDFWATWCAPCRQEIPQFVAWQAKYRDQGFEALGVSMDDDPAPVPQFYKEFKMNYPVAIGNEKIAEAYGILGLPLNVLIGRDGRIYAKHFGLTDLHGLEQEIQRQLQVQE